MQEELKRQEEEKAEIEARLRERLAKQEAEEEKKLDPSVPMTDNPSNDEAYNDAPPYYQPSIVPQAPLNEDGKEMYDAFIAKLLNPFTPVEELR